MVRHYKKKKAEPAYSKEDLTKAVNDVLNRNKTYRQAQDFYGVPISVIYHRIKGRKVDLDRMGGGRPPAFSQDVEEAIAKCLIARSRMGYSCDREELLELITDYITVNNIKTPFRNNIPGYDWYYGFMRRNPGLSLKKPEHLQKNRKDARDPEVVYTFFEQLKNLTTDLELVNISKSCFIFNADESGFNCDPSRLRAIGEKGVPLSRVSGGSGRDSITVLACVSANGLYLPPLIVFKGAAVQAMWTSAKAYPGTLYGASKNGWMEEPLFYNWFVKSFIPYVDDCRVRCDLPNQAALLLYDGHTSHISVRIVETAIEKNVHLMRFPSHLTDKIQPLDKCVFGPIKSKWDKALVDYGKTQMGKSSGRLSKEKFSELLHEVWLTGMSSSNIRSGFESTGIYPVNPKRFPEAIFKPSALQRYKQSIREQTTFSSNSTSSNSNEPSTSTISSNEPSTSAVSANEQSTTTTLTVQLMDSPNSNGVSAHSVMDIFMNNLAKQNNQTAETSDNLPKKVTPRLKQLRYGEILTTSEVLKKLQQAEALKASKKKKEPKKNNKIQKKVNTVMEKPRKTKFISDTESEEDIDPENCINDDSDDDLTVADFSESQIDVQYETPQWNRLKPGTYVLVKFTGGLRKTVHYKYVCMIQSVDDDDGEIVVQGFRVHNSNSSEFTKHEQDISSISFSSVEAILPTPEVLTVNRKLIYKFAGTVDVFEKR